MGPSRTPAQVRGQRLGSAQSFDMVDFRGRGNPSCTLRAEGRQRTGQAHRCGCMRSEYASAIAPILLVSAMPPVLPEFVGRISTLRDSRSGRNPYRVNILSSSAIGISTCSAILLSFGRSKGSGRFFDKEDIQSLFPLLHTKSHR